MAGEQRVETTAGPGRLERYLGRQAPAESLPMLQLQLDGFRAYYNGERPHRALRGATPRVIFESRIKARPIVDRIPTYSGSARTA